ncbi:MAG: hypothetical protein J6B24_02730 [Clostridia bacterium]|nr:hypothetical protein [Clostridia bacterium]
MKLNMKYSVLPRLLALVFALALLLATAVTPVAAAKGDFTEWTYDAAARTLTATFPNGKTETYLRVEDSIHLRYDPAYDFEYRNTANIDGHRYDVYAAEEGGDVLAAVNAAGEWVFFATEEEMKKVEAMYTQEGTKVTSLTYLRMDEYQHYDMDKKFLWVLYELLKDPEAETLTDTLHGLRYAPRYELWLYDRDEMIAVNRGYLFDLAGDMYFIPAGDIPATALDENGQILPQEGVTVTLYRVPDDWQQDSYNAVYRASTHYLWGVESEAGSGNNTLTGDPAPVEFVYFTIAILGIAVPIAPLVLGLCLPHSAKQGYKKRWYLLAIFGGAWMLLGILVLVMMIVAL